MNGGKKNIKLDKNQPIYLGIDVHKNSWSLSIIHCNELMGRFTISPAITLLKKLLERYNGCNIYSVYEAGFSGFKLHRDLIEIGVNNIITPPNKIPTQAADRVKTDKRDSLKLANYLSKGLLMAIYIPPPEQLNLRQVLRTRDQYMKKHNRVIQQLKMLLHQQGINTEVVGVPKWLIDDLKQKEFPEYIKLSIETYIEEMLFLEDKIKIFDKIYKGGPKEECYKKTYEIIKSTPGIGPLIATALTYEIGDWKRFNNEKEISSYLGLTPSEYSSGEHVHRGRITGQGNSWLRGLMIEASWLLITEDKNMGDFYNRIKNERGKKRAITAVARKLICRIFSMVKNETKYKIAA